MAFVDVPFSFPFLSRRMWMFFDSAHQFWYMVTVDERKPDALFFCSGKGLWEVRSRLTGGIGRVIFVVHVRTMVLLHGFTKKTQKTPKYELELAIRRKKQLM